MTRNNSVPEMLSLAAGAILITLGVAHTVVFCALAIRNGFVPAWAVGELRGSDFSTTFATTPAHAGFWGGIGSAAIPLVLIGAWITTHTRAGHAVPWFVGHGSTIYFAIAAVIIEPSGFPMALVAGLLLIAAHHLSTNEAIRAADRDGLR